MIDVSTQQHDDELLLFSNKVILLKNDIDKLTEKYNPICQETNNHKVSIDILKKAIEEMSSTGKSLDDIIKERIVLIDENKKEASKILQEINGLNSKVKSFNQKIDELKKLINSKKKVNAGKGKPIEVTDHAVIRFMERVQGIDIKKIKQQILDTNSIGKLALVAGKGKYPISSGYSAVVENGVLVTIVPKR